MIDIGIFYGSTTCFTEMAAEKIQQQLLPLEVPVFNIRDHQLSEVDDFSVLIFGISTWDYGCLQEDWAARWADLEKIDLTDKLVALYGLGDQLGYADWYQDALGMLHDVVIKQGGIVIGETSIEGHIFTASKALTKNSSQFVGLALDNDSQFDLTENRIQMWCQQLKEVLQLN